MYKDNFIVVLKHNGKVLRESNDVVTIPFGTDYSIVLRNTNSRRAVVSVDIDGESVLNGDQLIVPKNNTVELVGAINKLHVNNKFRFIQKTSAVSKFRGDRLDDGLIRVEFTFEKLKYPTYYGQPDPVFYYNLNSPRDIIGCGIGGSSNTYGAAPGITVKGAPTTQDFTTAYVGDLEEESSVIVLKLQGYDDLNQEVKTPIMTKTKKQCTSCGKRWKSYIKYCGSCGTYL